MSQTSTSSAPREESPTEGVLVTGSLWQTIWKMSWPLLLTTSSASLIGLADMYVAGKLGSPQQASVGICEQILFMFLVFIMSISVGTTALVSRAAGAGNTKETEESAAQSISLSAGMGIVLAFTACFVAKFGLKLYNVSPDVVAYGTDYLTVYSFYLIPFSIISIINATYRALGDAKTPLYIVATMTLINISGDFLTVLHNWPIPGLGLRGLPTSAITASTVGCCMGLFFLSRSTVKGCFKRLFPVYLSYVKRILNIGIPSALQRLGWALSVFVVFFILAKCEHPTEAIASWTIGMRVEGLIFMPLMAFSLAISSIIGQNLGANRVDRAIKAGWTVTAIGSAMMVLFGGLLFLNASNFAHKMSTDPFTIKYTAEYLSINALAEPFLAVGMILGGALQGAGDTRTPMWITLFGYWIVRLPLAWILSMQMHMGPSGVWLAMVVSVLVSAFLSAWRFQSRGWVKTAV